MLKKWVLVIFLILCSASLARAQFLNNWYFDVDGLGGTYSPVRIFEYWDIKGNAYIDNYDFSDGYNLGSSFDFEEWGFFKSNSSDGGPDFPWENDKNYELTAIFYLSGAGVLGGNITFSGGWLKIYVDNARNYGNDTPDPTYYGANDGILIAEFALVGGTGNIDPSGIPNGQISLTFERTYMASGYFFDESMRDLTELPLTWVLGYSTTNASWLENPSITLVDEVGAFSGRTIDNDPPEDLIISASGQFRLQVVPEPASVILMGSGLILMAGFLKRKKFK